MITSTMPTSLLGCMGTLSYPGARPSSLDLLQACRPRSIRRVPTGLHCPIAWRRARFEPDRSSSDRVGSLDPGRSGRRWVVLSYEKPDEMLREQRLEQAGDAVADLVATVAPRCAGELREQRLLAERGARIDVKAAGLETAPQRALCEEPEVIALLLRRVAGQRPPAIGPMRDV